MSSKSSKTTLVHSDGIFHGLPVFPDTTTGLRAMVVGASGQSGQPMIDVLRANPQRWEKIYALSRRSPKLPNSSNVEHLPVDLLWEPDKISSLLREHGVQVSVPLANRTTIQP